jgi:hypothetical protein
VLLCVGKLDIHPPPPLVHLLNILLLPASLLLQAAMPELQLGGAVRWGTELVGLCYGCRFNWFICCSVICLLQAVMPEL